MDSPLPPSYAISVRALPQKPHLQFILTLFSVLSFPLATSHAQTLGDLTINEECTLAGSEGISRQLVRFHECQFADTVGSLMPHPGITLASDRVHDLLTVDARNALQSAAVISPLRISAAFRPASEQFVLYRNTACTSAEKPGSSSHQTANAVDIQNWQQTRDAVVGAGCTQPFPESDALHFECPGPDMAMATVEIFQKLWNLNHPEDQIVEDGEYGPQTEGKLMQTPGSGFAEAGCEPRPQQPDAGLQLQPDAATGADGGMRPAPADVDGCSVRDVTPATYWAIMLISIVLLLTRRQPKR